MRLDLLRLFQNRKSITRNKEHRIENQSPTEKPFNNQTDDYYPISNASTISPVSLPGVVQMPRMGYDVPFHPNPTYPTTQPFTQPVYPPQPPSNFSVHEMYPNNPNIMMTNGGQFYQPQQGDYQQVGGQPHQGVDVKRGWDVVVRDIKTNLKTRSTSLLLFLQMSQLAKNQSFQQQKMNRSSTKSLAELHQRKQEVISQLEKVVGKNAATEISNNASSLARQESQHDMESPTSPYNFFSGHITSGPTFVRSDSILAADDDYVPYDSPAISKYGPISRMHKDNGINQSGQFRDSQALVSFISYTDVSLTTFILNVRFVSHNCIYKMPSKI